MSTKGDRYNLPLWLHQIFNGLFPAALLAGISTIWVGEPPDSWRYTVSQCLMYSSIPIGFFFAAITKRLSIVEGLAGEVGYEEEKSSETRSSK